MNMNLNVQVNPRQWLKAILRYKTTLITLVIIALVGFTAYQTSRITAVEPDPAYMESQEKETATPNLKSNQQTLQQLRQLQSAGDTNIPLNVGKQNPFSLN